MSLDVADLRLLLDYEVVTFRYDADVIRRLIDYDKRASLYLKLNANVEYPSLTALATKPPLNLDSEGGGS